MAHNNSNGQLPPNLAEILASLSSFTQGQQNTQPQAGTPDISAHHRQAYAQPLPDLAHNGPHFANGYDQSQNYYAYGHSGQEFRDIQQQYAHAQFAPHAPHGSNTNTNQPLNPAAIPWQQAPVPPINYDSDQSLSQPLNPVAIPWQPPGSIPGYRDAQLQSEQPQRVDSKPPQVSRPSSTVQEVQRKLPAKPLPTLQDPTTIITWPAAVKHVTKLAARYEEFEQRIAKMIRTQHEHEAQWIGGRKALQEKQIERVQGQRKVDETLRSINASFASRPKSAAEAEKENAQELLTYDRKVHRAATTMTSEMSKELAALGVPFFGTREDLVTAQSSATDASTTVASATKADDSAKPITRSELVVLQRKMLRHLEDVCGDEGG